MRLADAARSASTGELQRDGYLCLEKLARSPELAALRADVERVLARPLAPGCERPHNTLVPLSYDDPPVARVLADRDRVQRLRSALGAEDLRWISGYVSVKPAESPPLWWHQDWWCWDHVISFERAPVQVALLLYLSDTDAENGALRVLPGSHHASVPLHALLPEAHAEGDELAPEHPALQNDPGQLTLPARAGDAVVFDYRLLHGTHANARAERRDCLLLSFAPCWSGLPEELRGHLIQHPAQPRECEVGAAWMHELLPQFDGPRADLALNRSAPAQWECR